MQTPGYLIVKHRVFGGKSPGYLMVKHPGVWGETPGCFNVGRRSGGIDRVARRLQETVLRMSDRRLGLVVRAFCGVAGDTLRALFKPDCRGRKADHVFSPEIASERLESGLLPLFSRGEFDVFAKRVKNEFVRRSSRSCRGLRLRRS